MERSRLAGGIIPPGECGHIAVLLLATFCSPSCRGVAGSDAQNAEGPQKHPHLSACH